MCHFLLYNALSVESMCLRFFEPYWLLDEIREWVNLKSILNIFSFILDEPSKKSSRY